jgi:hypothetical protein
MVLTRINRVIGHCIRSIAERVSITDTAATVRTDHFPPPSSGRSTRLTPRSHRQIDNGAA